MFAVRSVLARAFFEDRIQIVETNPAAFSCAYIVERGGSMPTKKQLQNACKN